MIVASEHGDGRVVVLGDSDLFGDDCIDSLDHGALWLNLVNWASRRAAAAPGRFGSGAAGSAGSGDGSDARVVSLIDATNALAELQAADGALRDDADREQTRGCVTAVIGALSALEPDFPNLGASIEDLHAWQEGGYGKPDFSHSLAVFRPEQGREDGRLHLAFFPMYKQNGSPDTCFEAVLVRVPWPDWIAELEATRYDNPKFVPVELVAATRGYDSECAVLFPEQVAVAERQPNNFGAIFCDRESARLRRVATAAADLLQINLPPDAARLLADPETSEQAYILWDLIHDRAHSRGDLPFDPFMVRQRAPYWMYSLEELRCDLTAFGEAVELEREGLAFARNVQYAILFDRLLRFPITGPRVRNYDGLGGQLLFAYLHAGGYLHWTDNRLTFEWGRVAEGVIALRDEVFALYRAGIDRTKLQHWAAAHDLVARYVPPAAGSRWVLGVRAFTEVPDPRPYCDEVLPDEFPLSIFYTALRGRVSAGVTVTGARRGFASDNAATVHPAVLESIAAANTGHAFGYGHDPYTTAVERRLASALGAPEASVFFVFNGSGANVLSLRAALRPWEAVIVSENAHLQTDEVGAPEAVAGVKLLVAETVDGRVTLDGVRRLIERPNDEHAVKPGLLSLTQATELGTLYSLEELRALGDLAHSAGLRVHVDGARFANAAAALGVALPELVASCGIDLLSFGGTKNGLMVGEAVVVFDQSLAPGMLHLRKQTLQLASKMRFIAAQFDALLHEDLWLANAAHANAMAQRLYDAVAGLEGVSVTRRPVANALFAIIAPAVRERLQQEFDFYEWDDATGEVRWMCSWDTTEADIDAFAGALRAAVADA